MIDNVHDPAPRTFSEIAEEVVDAVVHIKINKRLELQDQWAWPDQYGPGQLPDPFRDFFGDRFFQG